MAALCKLCLRLAVLFIVVYVVTRLGGYADHRPIRMFVEGGIRPSTFQSLANTALLFSMAFGVAELLERNKAKAAPQATQQQEPPKSE